jgi:hypothetical protein
MSLHIQNYESLTDLYKDLADMRGDYFITIKKVDEKHLLIIYDMQEVGLYGEERTNL